MTIQSHGKISNELGLQDVLSRLEQSKFEFILTGSWLFNSETTPLSDYDFFTCDPAHAGLNNELLSELGQLGFKNNKHAYSDADASAVGVYTWTSRSGQRVDIQLIDPAQFDKKKMVNEFLWLTCIFDQTGGLDLNKSQRTAIWHRFMSSTVTWLP